MIEQKCVRTYGRDYSHNYATEHCCKELNFYLDRGWKVTFVTPSASYTEYIIEREIDNSIIE